MAGVVNRVGKYVEVLMEILGFIGIIFFFIVLVLLMNFRGNAWQDFTDHIAKKENNKS